MQRLAGAGDFTGKRDETALVYPPGPAGRILLVGMGKADELSRTAVRRAAAVAAKRMRALGVAHGAFHLPAESRGTVSPTDAGQAIAEGLAQGAWQFLEMKRPAEDRKPALERVDILAPDDHDAVAEGHRVGAALGAGQTLARGIQVLPGNICTPTYVGSAAEELAARHGFEVTVLDKAAITREKMGALLAVAQGSLEEPRFIVLEYKGSDAAPVVLIGKGVTFDTGGISIKPAQNMEDMKYDMSGAAAVLGTFEALGRLRPAVHVVGLIPSTENMPSGTAVKPGDVVTSHFGKTIEVINTDAEGRLILCDALSWARRYRPAAVIDIATLTGAIVVALGHTASGVMGSDDALVEEVRRGRRARRRAGLAAAALGRVPGSDEVRHRRREERRRPAGRQHLRRMVPPRVRRRLRLGPSRHRGHRLHRPRGRHAGEGSDRDRRAALHRVRAEPERRRQRPEKAHHRVTDIQ